MRKFVRLMEPEILAKNKTEITENYIRSRSANPAYKFQWPQREDRQVYKKILARLIEQTQEHCSYCDGFPLKKGDYQIDHFKPKSLPGFYTLVAEWTNLYLCCDACQKRNNKYDNLLLHPDSEDYAFEDYFDYNFSEHLLLPNPARPAINQQRATITITLFDLNHKGHKISRQRMLEAYKYNREITIDDLGYRFMFDLIK